MVEDLKFNNTILTNIGHQMLTSISSGNKKITYTKAEAYTQDVSSISNETLQALTSLQGKELSANLLVSNDNGNVITITANFRNKGLTNDVVFNSIGWFAKLDTDDVERGITANQEYLIGITPANGAQTLPAPPADQSSSQAISLNLNMTLSDASNVNMTVSDAGAVHFNQLDDQLAKYTTTADLTKLLAGKADLGLSYTKAEIDAKLLDLTTDTDGKVSADQVQALISDKANISDVYTKSQIDSALSTRDAQINTKANASDVYTKSQIDSDFSARDTQINTKANTSDVYTKSDVDSALAADRGRLDKLEGTQTLDSPDFNSITASGVYYITNNTPANIKNNPASQWGVLVVSSGNGQKISQVYYPDDGSPQWCRLLNGSNWLPWYQLSTKKDVSNAVSQANKAQDTANQANTKAQNALDNKADKTTVEENLAAKANASDLSALQNSAMQVIDGNSGDDILSFRDEKIRCYNNAQNVQNLPDMSNKTWFYVITHTKKGWGSVTVISQDNCYWQNVLNYSNWSGWVKHATNVDITDLQNQINANDNGTITTGYDWNTATPTNQSRTLQNAWIVDQSALRGAVDRMNSIDTNVNGRLPLGGGNMTLRSTINWNGGEINDKTGNLGGLNWAGGSDWAKIYGDQDDNDNLDLAIDLGDDGSNHVSFRKNGSETSAITSDGHFTGTVDWSNVSGRPDVATHADVNNAIDSIRYAPQERRSLGADDDANNIIDDGVYRISGNPIKNGNDQIWCFLRVKRWDYNTIYQELDCGTAGIFVRNISQTKRNYPSWQKIATSDDISNLQNQIQQLKDNQFEVQTFTDATAAANWEAQRPGKRMAIVNS